MKYLYYLKDCVKFEPTIFSWSAWPQIVAPSNAGLYIKNRYLKIMESYLETAELHYNAANDPSLVGGPFINIHPDKKDDVRNAYKNIKEEAKILIELAECFHKLNQLLINEAKGYGIELLYKQVPEMLQGLVELSYDLNNFPRLRLIEPLIYKKYYDPKYQSIIMGTIIEDFRPFALSTPRFPKENEIEIKRPFHDELYDKLFAARNYPISRDFITEIFNTHEIQPIIDNFFQIDPPQQDSDRKYGDEGIRLRYFGHACVLIETKEVSILVDPSISYRYPTELKRYTINDLPERINYVLFTHTHEDHVVFEAILQLRHKVDYFVLPKDSHGSLADPSIRLIMQSIGFRNLLSLNEFNSIEIPDGEIIGIPFLGEHCDVEITSKLGYCVVVKGKKFLFLADSNNIEPYMYKLVFDITGPIDVVFIGMESEGGPLTFQYGGLITIPIDYNMDQTRRLSGSDFLKAKNIVEQSQCKHAYVYAMGQEPWLNHLMGLNYNENSLQIVNSKKFVSECRSRGINSELLFCQKEWFFE
jgi:L-ascorbate metabolism protein UlaG (beta-lactamase superfamily)